MTPPEAGPGQRGLSIAETELAISGSVDPWFSGYFTAALQPEGGIEVENAYFQTSAIGHGLGLEGGRFFSDIGYLNPQHQHAWDFVDSPLPYQAFLGGQLADDGVQLKWVAPTELFVELGGEAGSGQAFPGAENNLNGAHLYTLFGHVGGDVGDSNSWRAGLSYLHASPQDRTYDDTDSTGTPVTDAFSGTSKLWIADLVWKWAPAGNPTSRNFKLQGEYFWRDEDGTLTFDQEDAAGGPLSGPYSASQNGWYAQAVYQFMPRWRIGLRYSELVRMLEVPSRLDRAEGDVHPMGNPHIHTDPRNIARIADALARCLGEIDPGQAATYQSRLKDFQVRWDKAMARWKRRGAHLRGLRVVEYHKAFSYLFAWLGIQATGFLEPKPGVDPTTGHLTELLAQQKSRPAKMIVRTSYNDSRAADWFAQRARIPVVVLPFTVGGDAASKDLFSWYDDMINLLLKGAK